MPLLGLFPKKGATCYQSHVDLVTYSRKMIIMNTEQLTPPKISISLPRLHLGECLGLLNFCEAKLNQGRFLVACTWFQSVLRNEIERRTNELIEPAMLELPMWSGIELSDALLCFFCLSRHGITTGQAVFVDELLTHVIASCSSYMECN